MWFTVMNPDLWYILISSFTSVVSTHQLASLRGSNFINLIKGTLRALVYIYIYSTWCWGMVLGLHRVECYGMRWYGFGVRYSTGVSLELFNSDPNFANSVLRWMQSTHHIRWICLFTQVTCVWPSADSVVQFSGTDPGQLHIKWFWNCGCKHLERQHIGIWTSCPTCANDIKRLKRLYIQIAA